MEKKVDYPMYQCKYICPNCAIKYHHEHDLTFRYKVRNGLCYNYHPKDLFFRDRYGYW